ncbi:MAG: STAS domain-containing protein [Acidobacteriota bacterium]
MKVRTEMKGEIAVLAPKGSLVGGEETDELRAAVAQLIEKGNKKLIVDLGGVDYMNSTAIGALVSAHTSYANRSGSMILCNVNKKISNIFIVTKLSMIFQIETDLAEAELSLTK